MTVSTIVAGGSPPPWAEVFCTKPVRGDIHGQRSGICHPHDAETGVDAHDLTGDAGREIRAQERGSIAHVVDCDVSPERGGALDSVENLAEIGNTGRGQRLDRPG